MFTAPFTTDEGLIEVHELIKEIDEKFFENEHYQEYLLGYQFKGRIASQFNLNLPSIPGKIAQLSLYYTETMIDLATVAQLLTLEHPKEKLILKIKGLPAQAVEQLQQEWFRNTDITPAIRAYHQALEKANIPFRYQFYNHLLRERLYPECNDCLPVYQRIDPICKKEDFNERKTRLDSVYYHQGRRALEGVAEHWEKLDRHPYGQLYN